MKIDRLSNITYGHLQSNYLSRDIPVIITDSHDPWPNQFNVPDDFIEFMQTIPMLRNSEPCNTVTNLLQIRDVAPNVQKLLRQAENIRSNGWFLQFRNCDFEAVKASRSIFPLNQRPYFISSHLPPFHSSWFLLSNHYKMLNEMHVPVNDLVFAFQLSGEISGRLVVKTKCGDFCANQEFQLNAGESMLFNAEMWNFFYYNANIFDSQAELTITFIQEIHIN